MAYIEKTPAGSWRAQIRRKGFTPISKSFKRKVDAQAWARDLEGGIDDRSYHEVNTDLVEELFTKYMKEVTINKKSVKGESNRIKRFIRDMPLMQKAVSDVGYKDITVWRDERVKEVSGATVRREMNLLSSVFNHAITEWHINLAVSPTSKVKRPPKPKARSRRVLDTELAAIWAHFGHTVKTKRSFIPWLFEFAIETGMRVGELCRLRWQDVHEVERWVYVLPSKNDDDRSVPLSPRACILLSGLPRKDARVFPLALSSVDTEFRRATAKQEIMDLHFHDTRHEACTRLSKVFSVLDLAKVVGHRDLKSLMVYYNPTPQELAAKFDQPQSKDPRLSLATEDDAQDG